LEGERARSFRAKKNLKVFGLEVGNCFGSIRLATDKTPQARTGLGKVIERKVCEAVNHVRDYGSRSQETQEPYKISNAGL
jgi:hypothetical protein